MAKPNLFPSKVVLNIKPEIPQNIWTEHTFFALRLLVKVIIKNGRSFINRTGSAQTSTCSI